MSSQLVNIAITMALCFLAWGLFYNFLHRRVVGYVDGFLWTTAYFFAWLCLACTMFWGHLVPILEDFDPMPLMLLCVFIMCQTIFFVYFPRYVQEPRDYFGRYPDRYYLKIHWRRLVAKSFDIAAQQVLIVLLVLFLRDAGLPLAEIVIAFAALFMLLHVPLIVNERGRWPSWLFAGAVLVFSVLFPPLILHVSYGFMYTYMIHWIFYMVTSAVFWLRYDK